MSGEHEDRAGAVGAEPVAGSRSLTGRMTKRARSLMVGCLALGLTGAAMAGIPAQAVDTVPPAGPGAVEVLERQLPSAPTVYTGRGAGLGRIDVTWDAAATPSPGPETTGYEITAVRAVGDGVEAGAVVRTPASGRSATVEGLTAGEIYDVEIAARGAAGESTPSVMRVRASDHVVPTATAVTNRVPDATTGTYAPLVTTADGDFGVHLDPVPGLVDADVHYTTDGSAPTLDSPTFVPGAPLQVTQDTTVRWIVVDGGNIAGPEGSQRFDIAEPVTDVPETVDDVDEQVDAVPAVLRVALAPPSGVVDVTVKRLEGASAYRVQAYTGNSVDVATGVRVGTPFNVPQPAEATLTEVTRRIPGLTDGAPYRFTVAARYGTVWTSESALSEAITPQPPARADAGPDRTVVRGGEFVLDGRPSPRAASYQWTQVRPVPANNAGFAQDPAVDLDPNVAGIQSTTGPTTQPTLRLSMPMLTSPTSDHNLLFRLTTVSADGLTRNDMVVITAEAADTVVAEEVRWRVGDELSGTGTKENAVLTFHDGSATGPMIGRAAVVNGRWVLAAGAPALAGDTIYVWSDHGFTGTIAVTD